ncbi:general transcription and DNA repair factor IIH helicase subunit XPD, partial [Caerostris extrusa]
VLQELRRLLNYIEEQTGQVNKITGLCLSSEKNLCCHPEVSKEKDGRIVDGRCFALTASHKRSMAAVDPSVDICAYFEVSFFEKHGREFTLPAGVYDLDDLKNYGKKNGWCPYFLARHAITHATIVVYSYHYLLDPKIADLVSKEMSKSSVVVFDEAHNIDSVCIESMSVDITRRTIERSQNGIQILERTVDKIKDTDAKKLQEEYQRMVEGLREAGIARQTDIILSNPVLPDEILKR